MDNVLDKYSRVLMSALVQKTENARQFRTKLFRIAAPKVFRDEAYVLYSLLYEFKEQNINIGSEFILLYLTNNRKKLRDAANQVDLSAYGDVDGDEIDAYISGVVGYFESLLNMPVVTADEFDLALVTYLMEFKNVEYTKLIREQNQILTSEMRHKGKILSGVDDANVYYRTRFAEIESLIDMNNGRGFRTAEEVKADSEESQKSEKISDFHKINELNNLIGGIYSDKMYVIFGPPKAGKSKLATRLAHQALTEYGQNITVWAVEGGSQAWLAQLRAIHFDSFYNDGASITERKYGVSQGTILKNELDPELKALEDTSYNDLVGNAKYGKIHFIDRPFHLETFLEEIDTSVKANGSSMIVVDYMQLLSSKSSKLKKNERLAAAFPLLLNYQKANNVASILPAQYSQESVKELLKTGDLNKVDIRTMGGDSSEIIRTTDYIIPLFASTEDIKNHKVTILPTASRLSSVTDKIDLYIDGETCLFSSINED